MMGAHAREVTSTSAMAVARTTLGSKPTRRAYPSTETTATSCRTINGNPTRVVAAMTKAIITDTFPPLTAVR